MHTPQTTIFRENALKELNNVQSLKGNLTIINTHAIAYFVTALLALSMIVLWFIFGEIEVKVAARGILLPAKNILAAEAVYRDHRREQENLVHLTRDLLIKKQELYQKRYITIGELEQAKQAYLNAEESAANIPKLNHHLNNPLFTHAGQENESLDALLFVNNVQGKQISPGMPLYLLPTFLSPYEYGYINGKVAEVSQYPISKELAYTYLGNMNLIDEYFSTGTPFVIKVKLARNQNTVNGLSWTTRKGAPFQIGAGSTVTASIVTQKYHPYELLLSQSH